MNKRPAFQFYPKDFMCDANIIAMGNEELGAYIRLLCVDWIEGGIPDDNLLLSRLSWSLDRWDSIAMTVLSCFEKRGDRYYNPRLSQEREKQNKFFEEKAEAGRKGAKSKWSKKKEEMAQPYVCHDSVNGKTIAKDGFSSSSSSPDIKKEYKEKKPCESEAIQPEAEQPEPESKPAQKRKKEFTPPTSAEVKEYARSRRSHIDPQKFFDFYDAGSWKDSKGKPVLNWKQKFLTWEGREPRPPEKVWSPEELAEVEKIEQYAKQCKGMPSALDIIFGTDDGREKGFEPYPERQNQLSCAAR